MTGDTIKITHDANARHSISRFFRRLTPFPFAGVPVVAGDAALDHFVAPLIARHDEGSEVAAAKNVPNATTMMTCNSN